MREGARLVEEGIKVIRQVHSHLKSLVSCSDIGEAVVASRISERCRQLQVSDSVEQLNKGARHRCLTIASNYCALNVARNSGADRDINRVSIIGCSHGPDGIARKLASIGIQSTDDELTFLHARHQKSPIRARRSDKGEASAQTIL